MKVCIKMNDKVGAFSGVTCEKIWQNIFKPALVKRHPCIFNLWHLPAYIKVTLGKRGTRTVRPRGGQTFKRIKPVKFIQALKGFKRQRDGCPLMYPEFPILRGFCLSGEKLKIVFTRFECGRRRSSQKLPQYRSHVCRNPLCKK